MPFVKLDCDMLESSLWDWTPERHIFITALLMAKPFELKEPAAQMEVDSLDPTGWTVPAGLYGFIRASGTAIIKKALALSHVECLDATEDFTEAMSALRALGKPDEDSRSQAFDGRRLVRIDGGYIVLNFQSYRDKDHTATERKRRQREREKEELSHRDNMNGHAVTADVTQAEAESEADSESNLKRLIERACASNSKLDVRIVEIAVTETMIRWHESPTAKPIRSVKYFAEEIATWVKNSKGLSSEGIDAILGKRRQQVEKMFKEPKK